MTQMTDEEKRFREIYLRQKQRLESLTDDEFNALAASELSRLKVAQRVLYLHFPFLGVMSTEVHILRPTRERTGYGPGQINTAAISYRGVMGFNPVFTADQTDRQLLTLLAHEAFHPAMNLWARIGMPDPDQYVKTPDAFPHITPSFMETANKAHDHVINLALKAMGLDPIDDWLCDKKYENKSFEQVLLAMLDEQEKKPQQQIGDGEGMTGKGGKGGQSGPSDSISKGAYGNPLLGDIDPSIGEILDEAVWGPAADRTADSAKPAQGERPTHEESKKKWDRALAEGIRKQREAGASARGTMPAWLVEEIEGMVTPKVSLDGYLRHFFGRWGRKERATWNRPNKRNTFDPGTAIYPGRRPSAPRVYMLLDVSGSMGNASGREALLSSLGTAAKLAQQNGCDIHMYQADTEVKKVFSADEIMKMVRRKQLPITGCGGSNFNSAFQAIWKNIAMECSGGAPVLCFTDGDITVPDAPPRGLRTETIWITTRGSRAPTKNWGTQIEMSRYLGQHMSM